MDKVSHSCFKLAAAALFFIISAAAAQETVTVPLGIVSYADMIAFNGKVVTMDDRSTNTNPGRVVQAMAVRDGKILAVGTDREVLLYAGLPPACHPDIGMAASIGET